MRPHSLFRVTIESWMMTFIVVVMMTFSGFVEALKCVQCSYEQNSTCLTRPGKAHDCPSNVNYCVVIKEYDKRITVADSMFNRGDVIGSDNENAISDAQKKKNPNYDENRGILISLVRTCMSFNTGNNCLEGRKKSGSLVTVCKEFCQEDGCNISNVPKPPFKVLSLIVSFIFLLEL